MADDLSSDDDEVRESVPRSLIKEMCAKRVEVQLFVEKYHPDTLLADRAVHIFNDNAMMHFRKILQHRQKQLILDKFLAKKAMKAAAEEDESTVSKTRSREKTPKMNYPVFLWRGTPLEKVCKQIKYKLRLIIILYSFVYALYINMFHKYTSFSDYIQLY